MKINKIKEAITNYFGKRCGEYEKGCACCEAWKQFDELEDLAFRYESCSK